MPNVSPRQKRLIDAGGILIAMALAALQFLLAYRRHPHHPHIGGDLGWWGWFDQERYWAATLAWSRLDLSPDQHFYLPGYSMLGAPFVGLASVHAYAIVNLVCLLASLVLFAAIAGRLGRQIPHARLLGAVVFTAVTCFSPLVLDSWVVPWTTTGATPLTYACLLAAIHFIETPNRPSLAFWTGLAAAGVAAFRPTDLMPLMTACAFCMGLATLRRTTGWRPILAAASLGTAGTAIALAVVGGIYVLLYGFEQNGYVAGASLIGFEWRMIPQRWVTLFLDPRPLFTDGQGMIEAFPWLAAGLAGAAAIVVSPSARRDHIAHLAVILAIVLHIALYLAFRDLHPDGLFRFRNYHYFKWVMPFLGLYGVLLLHSVVFGIGHRLRLIAAAVLALCIALPWRAELVIDAKTTPGLVAPDGKSAVFTNGMPHFADALLIPATGEWGDIYFGPHKLVIADRKYLYFGDFRAFPRPGGMMLVPLRPLIPGEANLAVSPKVTLNATSPTVPARQTVTFGLPCWLPSRFYLCPTIEPIAPPVLRSQDRETITFQGQEAAYLGRGWSVAEPGGRWTEGRDAHLRFRLETMDRAISVVLAATGYNPGGSRPVDLAVAVNGTIVGQQTLSSNTPVTLTFAIPAAALKDADWIDLNLQIHNPRAPQTYDKTSRDDRELGLYVREVSIAH